MKGFKKDGKFRPTEKKSKSSLKKSDIRKKVSIGSDKCVICKRNRKQAGGMMCKGCLKRGQKLHGRDKRSLQEIGTEIWVSKSDDNLYHTKIMMMINRLTGKEETWLLQRSEVDPAWVIGDNGEAERSPAESYGANGFVRKRWIENKIEDQEDEDDDY